MKELIYLKNKCPVMFELSPQNVPNVLGKERSLCHQHILYKS